MSISLTAVYRKVPEGYIGFVEELPGANTQGATIEVNEYLTRKICRDLQVPEPGKKQ